MCPGYETWFDIPMHKGRVSGKKICQVGELHPTSHQLMLVPRPMRQSPLKDNDRSGMKLAISTVIDVTDNMACSSTWQIWSEDI